MKFVDELSDWMYIDEYCQKVAGKADPPINIYLNESNSKVTMEFKITDLARANNLINVLSHGDYDGELSKTLGVKMERYHVN